MHHVLLGKTITGVKIASDKKALLFSTNECAIVARADADCCSNTWVEHVELPAMGFPAKVISATNIPMEGSTDDGELKVYGFKIETDKGAIILDYRNESNGYYGGDLVWPGDHYFYGGVYQQNISTEQWEEVKE